jgi:hypothetical protein
MADAHKNFAYSTIATAPSPTVGGTSLVVASGQGTLFPTPPFNATVWPSGEQPTSFNAEIIRVTAISTDTFTILRAQEGTIARNILVGDQIAASITVKTLTDVENPVGSWSPFIFSSASGSGVQTLASASGQSSSGSMLVFPVTVNGNVQFNQAVLPVSVSYVTGSVQGSASYYSYFGLYSMNASTALSLMANGSFSMAESFNTLSRTWSFATTTNTSGYGYDTLAMSNTAEIVNYISRTRWYGDYLPKIESETPTEVQLLLEGKKENLTYAWIRLWIEKSSGKPLRTEYLGLNGKENGSGNTEK